MQRSVVSASFRHELITERACSSHGLRAMKTLQLWHMWMLHRGAACLGNTVWHDRRAGLRVNMSSCRHWGRAGLRLRLGRSNRGLAGAWLGSL
jgi:hypothetical protein